MLKISVPLNSMFADLDESLRGLLRRELARQGYEGVDIAFEAPARDWSSALSVPTVNLFLHDIREAGELRDRSWREQRADGAARLERPPLRVCCAYAVTAWTRVVADEHRLLSQVLAVLNAYNEIPGELLAGGLAEPASQRFPVTAKIGAGGERARADFWNAVGGQYKVSLDYVVTLSCEPGAVFQRGPEVRTHTLRTRDRDGAPSAIEELHHAGGVVRDAAGDPVGDAWVALTEQGAWTVSTADGRFRFASVPRGRHRCVARCADGTEVQAELVVPGPGIELVLDSVGAR